MPQYKKVFDVGTYAGVSGFTRVGIPTLRTPGAGGKQVAKSLRFRSANSAYLSRTPSLGDRTTWTWSAWVKRGAISVTNGATIFGAYDNASATDATYAAIGFAQSDTLTFGAWNQGWRTTTQAFKDPSVWYHIVVALDTGNATPDNRVKIYVNGIEITAFSTKNNPTLSQQLGINSVELHTLGRINYLTGTGPYPFDGYLSEVYLIDGQALTPSSFGEYNSDNIWVPKAYSGSFAGTNSFYLDFSDVGTTTAGGANTGYGKDLSGKGTPNNWTTNNFGTTSTATTYDSMYDSPTDYDNSVYGAGNYATFNPLVDWHTNGSNFTFANGNLDISEPAATTYGSVASTIAMTTGKWYCEVAATTVGAAQYTYVGLTSTTSAAGYPGQSSTSYSYGASGSKINNGTGASYGNTFASGDIIGVAFDADAGSLTFYKNGQSQGTAFTSIPAGSYYFVVGDFASSQSSAFSGNFGQQPFRGLYVSGSGSSFTGTGAPPSGFSALNTKNITRPTDANMWFYGDTPDLMWIKNRSATADHSLTDTVRGVGLGLSSSSTAAEQGAQDVAEMNKFGMTLIGASSRTTAASNSFVYWAWKGGGAAVTNNSGTITSTVSANVSAGFSIVSYTGDGSINNQVGHGLGAAPTLVIYRNRTAVDDWWVLTTIGGSYRYLQLDTTVAAVAQSGVTISSTTIPNWNFSSKTIAYCFTPIAGYSAFGSYTGNGSTDGPFVYTGFRPRYLLIKRTDSTGNWNIIDTSRSTYNVTDAVLWADLTSADATGQGTDILSNGFKLRSTGLVTNASSGTYIYAAFAEIPFKIARAR